MHIALGQAEPLDLLAVRDKAQHWTANAVAVVHIDHRGLRAEQGFQLGGHGAPGHGIGAVDLGQQGRQHRRPRRGFDDLDRRSRRQRQVRETTAQVEGDGVAAAIALALGCQHHRQITLFRAGAQEVMTHQAVEIERRGRPGIALQRLHLGQGAGHGRRPREGTLSGLETGSLGHVQHDLKLGLVVEREQLHRHRPEAEHRHGEQRGEADHDQEGPGTAARADDRGRHLAIQATQHALAVLVTLSPVQGLAGQSDHQPRRDDDGDEEGEDHGRRGVDGDRCHIGAHQARDEQHGQQGGDHGQGRDHGRIADLGHGLDGGLGAAASVIHGPVAGDVLDHHNGVVDEDADREDQGEQADPVDGVAHQIGREEGQQDGRGDHYGRHARLAPADGEADQDDDREGRQAKMHEQLIGLFVGGLPIVAGDNDIQACRDQRAFQSLDPLHHRMRDDHGIGPLAFGDRQADGGCPAPSIPGAGIVCGARLVLTRGLNDGRDVAKVNRLTGHRTDGQQGRVVGRGQPLARAQGHGLTLVAEAAGRKAAVGLGDGLQHRGQGHAARGHAGGVGLDPDFRRSAADDEGQADVVDLPDLRAQPGGDIVEGLIAPARGGVGARGQRQHDRGHVIDTARNDLRLGHADGDGGVVGAHLLMDPNRRRVRIRTDHETGGDHDLVILHLGVDVLDAVDAAHDRFQRLGRQFRSVGGAQPGRRDHDIDHRHADLRLLLAGDRQHGHQADGDRRQQHQGSQRRIERGARQPPGKAEVHRARPPLADSGARTTSPTARPDSTSTRSSPAVPASWTGASLTRPARSTVRTKSMP